MSESSDYRDYQGLCDRVEKIDADAAKWLREEAPKTKGFEYNGDLDIALFWRETPQGHDFWHEICQKLRRVEPHKEMVEDFFKPEVDEVDSRATGFGPMRTENQPMTSCHELRGSVLKEAMDVINGERQDVYGSPEDSFSLISDYWTTYLRSRSPEIANAGFCLFADDVAMMMTLFKIAREANQHKRDNIVDAAGYLGIYADMQEAK